MLKVQIQQESIESLKSGDQFKTGVLRMLLASITSKEKEKRYKISKEKPDAAEDQLLKESELADEQIIEVVVSEIKKRKDAIVLYEQGNRPELAEKEKKEIEILKKYLPEQLSESELRTLIEEAIKNTGAKEMKDTGKIMAELMPKVKGKADGSEIAEIIKQILSR